MPGLELRFFGALRWTLDDRPLKLDRRKAEALLAYLVLERGEHRRAELAVLLWPEQPAARGKAALRRTLRTLTAALGKGRFRVDRNSVALAEDRAPWADVTVFDHAVARAFDHPHGPRRTCEHCLDDLTEAVSLHRGDFLSGLTLRDAPAFDEWHFLQSERLRDLLAAALEALVRFHVARGANEDAVAFARRWVLHDPLDEASHETLMRIFAGAGKRGAALRLYDDYARRLESELGIEPPRSMAELRGQVQTQEWRGVELVAPEVAPDAIGPRVEAWRSACRRRDADAIDRGLDPLCGDLDRRGLYHVGIEALELALGALDEGPLLGRILARKGALLSCVGRLSQARALLEAGLRFARARGDCLEVGYCENRLGAVLFAQGSYARARRLLRASVDRYREAACKTGLPWALNVWGHLSIGTREARAILAESLERGRRAGDEGRVASALNSLGKEALSRRSYARAIGHLERSLETRRRRKHRIGIADALNNLARARLGLEEVRLSREALEGAMDVCRAIDARPLLAEAHLTMALVHRRSGEPEAGARAAAAALHAPGAWQDAKEGARSILVELSRELPPAVFQRAIEP
jgi:DNA-binding SARP family transcriptional activator